MSCWELEDASPLWPLLRLLGGIRLGGIRLLDWLGEDGDDVGDGGDGGCEDGLPLLLGLDGGTDEGDDLLGLDELVLQPASVKAHATAITARRVSVRFAVMVYTSSDR